MDGLVLLQVWCRPLQGQLLQKTILTHNAVFVFSLILWGMVRATWETKCINILTEIFIRITLNFRLICGNRPVCNIESPNPWIWYILTYLDFFFFQFSSAVYYSFQYIGPVPLGLDLFSTIWFFFGTIVNDIICKYYFMYFLKC